MAKLKWTDPGLVEINTGVELFYDFRNRKTYLQRGRFCVGYDKIDLQKVFEKVFEKMVISNRVVNDYKLSGFLREELIVDFMTRWLAR